MYHTQRHAFRENTGAIISTNLHDDTVSTTWWKQIKMAQEFVHPKKINNYLRVTYAAQGGRRGYLHLPASTASLVQIKEINSQESHIIYHKA